jgi:hypothetical protein
LIASSRGHSFPRASGSDRHEDSVDLSEMAGLWMAQSMDCGIAAKVIARGFLF